MSSSCVNHKISSSLSLFVLLLVRPCLFFICFWFIGSLTNATPSLSTLWLIHAPLPIGYADGQGACKCRPGLSWGLSSKRRKIVWKRENILFTNHWGDNLDELHYQKTSQTYKADFFGRLKTKSKEAQNDFYLNSLTKQALVLIKDKSAGSVQSDLDKYQPECPVYYFG